MKRRHSQVRNGFYAHLQCHHRISVDYELSINQSVIGVEEQLTLAECADKSSEQEISFVEIELKERMGSGPGKRFSRRIVADRYKSRS